MMIEFFPLNKNNFNFNQYTLLLPSLSIGNVGQLSMDLLIYNCSFTKIGYLDSEFIIPLVGNDAYSDEGKGILSTSLEIFMNEEMKLIIIQQRSPIIKRKQSEYFENLIEWIQKQNFERIILINSSDKTLFPHNLQELFIFRYFYYSSNENNDLLISFIKEKLKWKEMEIENIEKILKNGTSSYFLYEECKKKNINLVILTLFCFEGNNIPEAIFMSNCLYELLFYKKENKIHWKYPSSWNQLEGTFNSENQLLF
jgi:proteasome assembly chaperone 2